MRRKAIFGAAGWVGIAALAAIVVAGIVTCTRISVLSDSTRWVNHTERVRFALQHTLMTLADAESATRGFYITREEEFLAPFERAQAQLDSDLRTVNSLVADNPRQQARATELAHLAQARLARMSTSVANMRAGTFIMPKPPLAASESKRLMDAVRSVVGQMQAEEDALLASRLSQAERARHAALISAVSLAGVAGALVLLLILVEQRAGRKVRDSQQWLATTLSSIGDAVIATDAGGSVRFINPVAAELTGWDQAEARGRPLDEVFNIISESHRAKVESPVSQVLREGNVVGLANHTLLIRRDGTEFPIEDSGAPIRDGDGGISGVVLVFKDASAARHAQVELQTGEERLRLALESAELGALDHDLQTGVAVWNDRMYAILGYPTGTPVTAEMINLRTEPEDWKQVHRALQRASAEHHPFHFEHRIVRASDGAVRWVSAHGSFIYDSDGKAIRYIGVLQDVSENLRLEQQVRQSQKLDALGTLAGGIAHDFNNILAVLRGNLVVMRADLAADSPLMPTVLDMTAACNRATALVRQILTFGRRHEQDRKLMQLDKVVAEGMQLLRATLPARIELRCQNAPGLPPVLVDPNQIQQIIANLGINSTHAIGSGSGVISVDVEALDVDAALAAGSPDLKEGRYIRLAFSDTGSGMPREVMDRIFEPFFTTKSTNEGTGLGLSVVRGILKNHDAAINVYSEPGKGTRFNIYFPVAAGETVAEPAPQTAAIRGKGRGERILYIDDEESLVILARRMLERMGYRVTGFKDPQAAVAAFAAAPQEFDLVLTDLSMPGTSGMDVARQILAIRPDTPILLATGYVRAEDVEMARTIGIREVIWKPQTITEMGDLLARQLEQYVPSQSA